MASAKDSKALQDFRFKVDHRPVREHANADALSRRDACLWSVRDNPRLQPAVEECGNPVPTPQARRMAYTADIHQSEPESVHCVTLIGAMENTCGVGQARPGTPLKGCDRFS